MKRLLQILFLVIAVIIAGYLYKKYRVAPDLKFQTLQLTDLNGNTVKLQDYHNKKVFLNFFQTWCGPCIGEFPVLDEVAEELAPDNFIFISISDEPTSLLTRVQEHFNPKHLIILHSVKPLKELGVFTYPTSYLLNANGQVVFQKTGNQNWSQTEVIQMLKQKSE